MSKDNLFPNYLFRLRTNRDYSQKQLAGLLGLRTRKAISDFEAGRRLPAIQIAMQMEIVLGTKLSEIYPDLYRNLGLQAIDREDRLPARFSRHIRGRVLGKDPDDYFESRGRQPQGLPTQDPSPVRGVQRCFPF